MKRSLFLLLLFTWAYTIASAQGNCTLSLKGRVLDEFGKGLSGATVFIMETGTGRVSDENGDFVFANLCAGKYTIEINFLGYETFEKKLKLDRSDELTFPLTPSEQVLNEIIISDHPVNVGKANNFSSITSQELEETKGKSLGETLQKRDQLRCLSIFRWAPIEITSYAIYVEQTVVAFQAFARLNLSKVHISS